MTATTTATDLKIELWDACFFIGRGAQPMEPIQFCVFKMTSLYAEIKTLEERIALTEYYLANCKSDWDSLFVSYDIKGMPYSAYASNEELNALQMAINEHQACLRRDRDDLLHLRYKYKLEMEESKKADEDLMKMFQDFLQNKNQ
jgi:hypothetical protein